MYQTLKELIKVHGVSGREGAVAKAISEKIAPYVDEISTDALGNLIALKKGNGENKRKRMLCAHMDEIGFLITFIEDSGLLRIAPVGGIHFAASAFTEVVSESGVHGVLVPNDDTKPADFAADKFYIDIGAKNKKDAERRVSIGDFFVCAPNLIRLMNSRVAGRPFDDRVGCAVVIENARYFSENAPKNDVYYVFSVQEEVGLRGAKTSAYSVDPDYALVFDVTGTGDTPSAKPMACSVGSGAAIKIKDSSVICHREVVASLVSLAKANKITHQCEILAYGGTDTAAIQMSRGGAKVGAISIPTRYIHSGVELLDMKDAKACSDLSIKFIESI